MTARRVALIVSLAVTMLVANSNAQTYQGGVRGAVRDANGVVPGADVTLVNEDTNLGRTTVSNAVGEYAFPNVIPGIYTVSASLSGFKTFESRGIRVGTQDFLTLDLSLEIGEVREAITVTGATPVIDTTTASVGTLLERQALETLPNVGRNPFVISTIAPNVIPTGIPQFVRMQDQNATAMLSLGGGPRRANNFLLDGVPITDIFNRAAIIPSIEALEEVRIQVSTYDAELGRTGGGVFNTTHKSGTNSWRGSALFLDRPQWGTGKLFFARKEGTPKPETFYHLWGGSFGGPLIENRTFFLASTEGYKTQTTGECRSHPADGTRAPRRLFAILRCARAADRHLRPVDDATGSRSSRPVHPRWLSRECDSSRSRERCGTESREPAAIAQRRSIADPRAHCRSPI